MSEKFDKIIEEVKEMSVLELSELVSALEEEFGVSAAAGVVVAAGDAAGAAGGAGDEPALVRLGLAEATKDVENANEKSCENVQNDEYMSRSLETNK